MIKKYIFYIPISTFDLLNINVIEQHFYMRNAQGQLFQRFLNDDDFKIYNSNAPYKIKYEKLYYNEIETNKAEQELISKYFSSSKSIKEIEEMVKERVKKIKPYNLMLTVEVEDENNILQLR